MLAKLGLLFWILWAYQAWGQSAPKAIQGEMSLAAWDPSVQKLQALAGEWRLIHGRFVTKSDIPRLDRFRSDMIESPGQTWANLKLRPYHYGSYILYLKDLPQKGLGIFFDQFFSAHSSFLYYQVDNELREVKLTQVGVVAKTREESIPQFLKAAARLPDDFTEGYLVIHVSNFVIAGSMLSVPSLGDYESQLAYERGFVRWEGFFILGAFFLLLVTNFALFVQRNDDKGSLYITAFAAALAVRYFSTEGLWAEVYSEPSFELWLVGMVFTLFGLPIATMFMTMFLNFEFPDFVGKKTVLVSQLYNIALLVMIAVTYPRVSPDLIAFAYIVFLLILPVLLVQVVHAAFNGARGASLSAVGLLILMLSMANDVLVGAAGFQGLYVGHYGMLAFVFTQSQVVGKNFAHAFNTAEKLSRQLALEVERQTRDAKVILKSVHQGLLTINADGTVNDDYSAFVKMLLGEEKPEGKHINDIFLSKTNLTREKRDMTLAIIETSVGEDQLGFEINSGNLPRSVILDSQKILELYWQPVVNEKTELCEKILLTVQDVTALKALEQKTFKTQKEMSIITHLLEISNDRFLVFYRSSRDLIDESRRLAEQTTGDNLENIRLLFVNMHTIKGAARTYHFSDITTVAHECEQYYAEVQRGEKTWERVLALQLIRDVDVALEEYFSINRHKLKRDIDDNVAKIDLNVVRDHIMELQSLNEFRMNPELAPIVSKMKSTFINLYFTDARSFFGEITSKLPALAHDLGKEAPRVKVLGPRVGFNTDGCEVLRRVFVHLLRNAVDHGLETPEIRQKGGKDTAGTITIELVPVAEQEMDILVYDDGAGLRLDRILEKAKSRDMLTKEQESSLEMIAEMIFLPGFSTASALTEVSGRGVGMDAVRKMLSDVGGRIRIELLEHPDRPRPVPFRFIIHFPSSLWAFLEDAPPGPSSGAA